jgi:hypothetical protein
MKVTLSNPNPEILEMLWASQNTLACNMKHEIA